MKPTVFVVATTIASILNVPAAAQTPTGIARVAWLQGCWARTSAQRTVEEQWMAPRGKTMMGMSRTVQGDRVVEDQFLILREQGDQLAYEAHPSGNPTAVFVSRTIDESSVVFENPEHDFPQRVAYRRDGPDALTAWIEGTMKGTPRRVEFAYTARHAQESSSRIFEAAAVDVSEMRPEVRDHELVALLRLRDDGRLVRAHGPARARALRSIRGVGRELR